MIKDRKLYRILVIEDNPGDFLIVEDFLSEQIECPHIDHATNFKEAYKKLSVPGNLFDVILLDLSLPDKSAQGLITEILEIALFTPVIILTGYSNIDFSKRSISLGILDYLLKDDLTAVGLYKSVLYAIERKKANLELAASEKQYSDLFYLSPQPMCLYDDGSFKITKVNKAAVQQFGYSEEELLNMTLLDLVPLSEKQNVVNQVVGQNRQLNKTYKGYSVAYKKTGERIEVETFSTPIKLNNTLTNLVIAIDVTEKNLVEQEITKAIIKTQEDERYEIGGELHDNVCQILGASLLNLSMIRKILPEPGLKWYNQCHEYIALATNEIRNLSHRLAPAFFTDSTLEGSFSTLLQSFNIEEKYEIELFFDQAVQAHQISQELQLNLYRILQEQLKNIIKYSNATAIDVEVIVYKQRLRMKISDNGVGFEVNTVKNGIGLANMKRRTELFSGMFELNSAPFQGCSILIEIPVLPAVA
jgi:PAS domain S-box-containing protein